MIEKVSLSELNELKKQLGGYDIEQATPINTAPPETPPEDSSYFLQPEDEDVIIADITEDEPQIAGDNDSDNQKKIQLLEQIKDISFELVQINDVLPTTYVRISSAIDFLMYKLIMQTETDIAEQTISASLEILDEIHDMAQPVVMDAHDIKISELMSVEISLLEKFTDYIMSKQIQEIEDNDIDELLIAFKNADKKIDDKQN